MLEFKHMHTYKYTWTHKKTQMRAERDRRERSEGLLRKLREARAESEKLRGLDDERRDKETAALRSQLADERGLGLC
jgi:hypothetical protein